MLPKLLTIGYIFLLTYYVSAQNFIPFQGIALDGSGKALASKKIGIKISILKDGASGAVSYAESHAPTTDSNGLFQINVGSGTALTNTFAAIDWSTLNYFLKLEMDVSGGSSYSLISNTQMGFVPFAFYANKSLNQPIYQKIGNTTDTLSIDESSTICETFDGAWQPFIKLPQPTSLNQQLNKRINTTLLINCKSSFSFTILKNNTNLKYNQTLSTGEYVLFLFDGTKWLQIGGKTPQVDGKYNTFIGQNALQNLETGSSNVAIGNQSIYKNTSGNFNTAIGANSLEQNITGSWNTAVGTQALKNNTVGNENVALGQGSLFSNITGSANVGLGRESLWNSTTSNNVAAGDRTLFNNSSGNNNTALGTNAGFFNKTGSNNLFIGYNAQSSTESISNEITFGDSNIKAIRSAVTSITSLSDARDKKNIVDLPFGLNFIQSLKPRSFQWDKREWYDNKSSDGSKMAQTATAGFIAQELDESQQKFNADWLNLVYKSNPEKLEANYGNLIPIIVKAIQDLSDENKKLEIENINIKLEIEKLKHSK